jgi:hypothetical protein
MKTGADVGSDSFKPEIPSGAKKLGPTELTDFDELPSIFTPAGAR